MRLEEDKEKEEDKTGNDKEVPLVSPQATTANKISAQIAVNEFNFQTPDTNSSSQSDDSSGSDDDDDNDLLMEIDTQDIQQLNQEL